jgi:hypothetical protein
MVNEIKILLREKVSPNLAFRGSADDVFNEDINNSDASIVVVDFDGIESTTRSFIHQYMLNKMKSDKTIIEINVPKVISPMFDLVEKQRASRR